MIDFFLNLKMVSSKNYILIDNLVFVQWYELLGDNLRL